MARRGKDTYLYISDDFEALGAAMLLVARSGDIDLDDKRESEDYAFRGYDDDFTEATIRKRAIKTTYMRKKQGFSDAVYTLLDTAFRTNVPLYVKLLDGPIATTGSAGIQGAFVVTDFTAKQPVKGLEQYTLELKPTLHTYNDGISDVDVPVAPFTV